MDNQRIEFLRKHAGHQGVHELLECLREIEKLQTLVDDINNLANLEGEQKGFSLKVQRMIQNV
jgi:hypothetical protein